MDQRISIRQEVPRIVRQEGLGVFLRRVAWFCYKELLLVFFRFEDWIVGRRETSPLSRGYSAKYHVTIDGFDPFSIYYRLNSPHRRPRSIGKYEVEISDLLREVCDRTTSFWEVGSGWGYHSLSLASRVDRVVAFDPDDDRIELLKSSTEANAFSNISIVNEPVVSLDEYTDTFQTPDVVLVDVDGWEYDILPSSPDLLASDTTWIVEVHHNVDAEPAQGSHPSEIEDLFRNYGYEVERIREHRQRDWQGNELDQLNTHHIVAQRE